MITANLTGKRALVTGGASGIGLATVEALLRCGATVAVNHLAGDARAIETVTRLARDSGSGPNGRVIGAPGDVSDPADAARMVGQAIADLGGLDILINNAATPMTIERAPCAWASCGEKVKRTWPEACTAPVVSP